MNKLISVDVRFYELAWTMKIVRNLERHRKSLALYIVHNNVSEIGYRFYSVIFTILRFFFSHDCYLINSMHATKEARNINIF